MEAEVSDGLIGAEEVVVVGGTLLPATVTLVEVDDLDVALDVTDVAIVVTFTGVVPVLPELEPRSPPSPKDVTTLGQLVWTVAGPGAGWMGLHPGRALREVVEPTSSGTTSLTLHDFFWASV